MSKTLDKPMVELWARCRDCKRKHRIVCEPGTPLVREMSSWEYKHRGHQIQFTSPRRYIPGDFNDKLYEKLGREPWFLKYRDNANFQFAFVASSNLTFTSLNSLASDTNLLAGASSLAVDNGATGVALEISVSGYIKNHTTMAPTVDKEIDVYVYAALDDGPTWPDTIAGTDATKTITTAKILSSGFTLVTSMVTSATTSQVNPFRPCALSSLFGVMPRYWGIFVVHNSGQALHSSGHNVALKGLYISG